MRFFSIRSWTPIFSYTPHMLEEHINFSAIWVLRTALRSPTPTTLAPNALDPGRQNLVFYNTSNHNGPVRWVYVTVLESFLHLVKFNRYQKWSPMDLLYQHARLKPTSDLSMELCSNCREIACQNLYSHSGRKD